MFRKPPTMSHAVALVLASLIGGIIGETKVSSDLKAVRAAVTPAEKVIELLEDLKAEVEAEGEAEAKTYDTFACFCKDKTDEKSDAIKEKQDQSDDFQATIDEQTEISNNKAALIAELDQQIATVNNDIKKLESKRESDKTKFEVKDNDLGHGVASLDGAIADMKSGKSLLAMGKSVRRTLAMADMLGMAPKHHSKLVSFIQENGDGAPESDYEFHEGSADIIATLEELDEDFKSKKSEVEDEEAQDKKDHAEMIQAKEEERSTAEDAKATAQGEKDEADGALSRATEDKALNDAALADDVLYLKDLTLKCELKAREFDQHSKMRAGEVEALGAALDIITARVQGKADEVNKRALLQKKTTPAVPSPSESESAVDEDEASADSDTIAFVQVASSPRSKLASLVQRRSLAAITSSMRQSRLDRVVDKLSSYGSPTLSALALKVSAMSAADPFVKVKRLIQDLIERLVKEAAEEATKKGWCDTELAKSSHTRDLNMEKVKELNSELQSLEAQKATLESEISTLASEIAELSDSLAKTTKIRADEKADNTDTVAKAKEGLEATQEAYKVLEEYYNKAKKEEVSLLQRASPVDEDAPEDIKGGAYKGNQQKAGGILAMLDVVISDFERTIKVTESDEKEALRQFTEFEKTTKTSITSKEASKSSDESALKGTVSQTAEDMILLEKHVKMLDDSLKEIEDLTPACIDTGMSYEERVQKRKDEVEALTGALCMLDADKVETECA